MKVRFCRPAGPSRAATPTASPHMARRSLSPARSAGTNTAVPCRRFRRAGAAGAANIVAVLREAAAGPEHIVRMTWYVTDKREYLAASREIGQAFRELIGDYDIAMSAVQVAALIEDRAKVKSKPPL